MNSISDVVQDFDERHLRIMAAHMLMEFLQANAKGNLKVVKHLLDKKLYEEEETKNQTLENKVLYNFIDIINTTIVREAATDSYLVATIEIDLNSNVAVDNGKELKERYLITLRKELVKPNPMEANHCPICDAVVNKAANLSCKFCGALYNIETDGWKIITIKKAPYVDEGKTNVFFTLVLIVITVVLSLKYQNEIFKFLGDIYNSNYFMQGAIGIGSVIVLYIFVSLIRYFARSGIINKVASAEENYIKGIIPEYNKDTFETAFYKIFEYILISKAGYNSDNMTKYISSGLNKKYGSEIKYNKRKKYVNILKDMNLESICIVSVNKNKDVIEMSLLVNFTYMGYITTSKGKVISGSDKNRTSDFHKLTFTKNSADGSAWVLAEETLLNKYFLIN